MKLKYKHITYNAGILLIVFLFVLAVFEGHSQDKEQNMIEVFGELSSDLGTLTNAEIKIKEDDFDWLNVKFTKRTGEFNLALPVGHVFLFKFIQEGTIAKQISFSTKTPDEYKKVEFDPFFFMVHLEDYTDTPEIDTLFYREPVGKIYFSEEFIKFDYDREYNLYVKNKIAQVKEEIQLRQQLLAQQAEQRRLDSIARANMLAQTEALKDTHIPEVAVKEDTMAVAAVTELPDSAELVTEEAVNEIVMVDEDTVLIAAVETAEIPEKIEINVKEPKAEIKPEVTVNKNTPEKVEIKPEEESVEVKVEEPKEPTVPVPTKEKQKPEPLPVAIGKPNGREVKYYETPDVQVTKIYLTRSKKTLIYSMYQYKNGDTKYYKQQPITNDSLQINREIFIRSIR